MPVRIISTGGTFEKQYDPIDGSLSFVKSHVPQMLEQARVRSSSIFEALPLLDSLDMTDEDRERVLHACQGAPEQKILIIHGTDTMCETALVLATASLDKTIVLTGAMVPYQVLGSDAFFNLGFAMGVVHMLPPDVYIAMNGLVFRWDDVRKNRSKGIFEADN